MVELSNQEIQELPVIQKVEIISMPSLYKEYIKFYDENKSSHKSRKYDKDIYTMCNLLLEMEPSIIKGFSAYTNAIKLDSDQITIISDIENEVSSVTTNTYTDICITHESKLYDVFDEYIRMYSKLKRFLTCNDVLEVRERDVCGITGGMMTVMIITANLDGKVINAKVLAGTYINNINKVSAYQDNCFEVVLYSSIFESKSISKLAQELLDKSKEEAKE